MAWHVKLISAAEKELLALLHVFVKKTRKTPGKALDTALERLQEIEQ